MQTNRMLIELRSDNDGLLFVSHSASHITEVKNDRFVLIVHGNLYLEDTLTMDPQSNANCLLDKLTKHDTLRSVLDCIQGGMYALIILDKRDNVAFISADLHGYHPFYWTPNGRSVYLADNQITLCRSLDNASVYEFLRYGYLPFSQSFSHAVHRLQPGQLIKVQPKIDGSLRIDSTELSVFKEHAIEIQNLSDAADCLEAAFHNVFRRIDDGPVLAGLSGGYDSRLIAAFLRDRAISLLNFGNPQSLEVRNAHVVSRILGLPIESYEIPTDAVQNQISTWHETIKIPSSLEYAHVGILAERITATQPKYYVDGFHGDVRVGSGFYYKINRVNRLLKNVFFVNTFRNPIKDSAVYHTILLNEMTGLSSAELSILNFGHAYRDIKDNAHQAIDSIRPLVFTHEGFLESLKLNYRVRSLTVNGPSSVEAPTICVCPFNDKNVLQTVEATAKHLRAGDRLYNALWRQCFPELCSVPKNDTGGNANQRNFPYRLRHAIQSTLRKYVFPSIKTLTRGRLNFTEPYFDVSDYVRDTRNANAIESGLEFLREHGQELDIRCPTSSKAFANNFPTISLRLATLAHYQSVIHGTED